MKLLQLLILIACNVLWSMTYAISKDLLVVFRPLEIAFLRLFIAGIILWLLVIKRPRPKKASFRQSTLLPAILIGIVTFYIAPALQLTAISLGRSMDFAILIALEPLVTLVLTWIFLKERLKPRTLLAFGFALSGALVLSGRFEQGALAVASMIPNLIFLLSIVGDGFYSVFSGMARDKRSPLLTLASAITIGAGLLFTHNMIFSEPSRVSGLGPLFLTASPKHIAQIAFLAIGATAIGYYVWMKFIEDRVSITAMTMTIYLQPIFGVVWGTWLMGESIYTATLVGMALILTGLQVQLFGVKQKHTT